MNPQTTFFDALGGEQAIRTLVDAFYDRMDREPGFAEIRAMHPDDLAGSRDKLFWFLCGWSGGPQHYMDRFGHPRLRMRHFPFAIGALERDQWLACMALALADCGQPDAVAAALLKALAPVADWMRNREPGAPQ